MPVVKIDLDEETKKQIRNEVFRPFALSIIIGLSVSLICALVAAVAIGTTLKDKDYSFQLTHADGWIVFTIFVAILLATSVVAYYKLKEEHQKITDDIYTPFRKSLVGTWRVFWTDLAYANENGIPDLKPFESHDFCEFAIDNAGKLIIISELSNHQYFENWKNTIEDISINLQKDRLSFFHESRFTIRQEIVKNPIEDRTFYGRFFVQLSVNETNDKNNVIEYDGKWYDLDGTFAKCKEALSRQLHNDLPDEIHFNKHGSIRYRKK